MKSRPTPANLYTTRRIGLKHWLDHWLDPESKTLFSQGKYPTKLTYWDLPDCFLSGTYYGAKGYLRTDSIKGLWYQPCYHTNHMFKDDFLYISYQHPISSCPLLDIYHSVDALPGIKKSFIGSGVRYDLLLHRYADESLNKAAQTYTEELIARHVSGRLKVAPEHTQDEVLKQMRKPSFSQFGQFKKIFDKVNRQYGLNQQLIPYFISSHPGCTEADMAELADVIDSEFIGGNSVQVQLLLSAPNF